MGTQSVTFATASPLRDLLRRQMERVLASCDAAGGGADRSSRRALRRFLDSLQELVDAADALVSPEEEAAPPKAAEILWIGDDGGLSAPLQPWLDPNDRLHRALDRAAALQTAAAHPPDLLLASASGLDALRALRELRPGVPAIVLGGPAERPTVLEAFAEDPVVFLRAPVDAQELALAVRTLLGQGSRPRPTAPTVEAIAAGSYAHLAGLLPRALERALDFDAGAAVIARPGQEPLVDVYGASHVSHEALETVRNQALALFRLLSIGVRSEDDVAILTARSPFRSTLHVPIAAQGAIVGVTYLVSSKAGAFSAEDQRALTALATNASGAYRRVENTARRLRATPRQAQILSLIAAGLSDNAVAERLGVAHRTVRTHLDRLLREHGLHSRTEAVTAWLRGQQD